MRNYTKIVGALAAASALMGSYASAEIEGEFPFQGEVHVGYASQYEFRFVNFGDDMVEAGADLAATYGGFKFSAGAWYGSITDSGADFNELDLYAGVSKDLFSNAERPFFSSLVAEAGYVYYNYQNVPFTNTQEVYFGLKTEIAWGVTAGARFYWDFDANNGWYLQPELSKSFSLIEDCLSLDVAAGIGLSDGLASQVSSRGGVGTADGFQGYYVSAGLPWKFRENATLTPYVKYTDADSKLITTGTTARGEEFLIGGVKVAVTF